MIWQSTCRQKPSKKATELLRETTDERCSDEKQQKRAKITVFAQKTRENMSFLAAKPAFPMTA